jgi:hypothetical protein
MSAEGFAVLPVALSGAPGFSVELRKTLRT